MGEIKSALELALEKTADIKSDKEGAELREWSNKGKKAAGEFMDTGDASALAESIAKAKGNANKAASEGAITNLIAALRLPHAEADIDRVHKIGAGLDALLPGSGMTELFGQVATLFGQYLADRERTEKGLEQQFMPRLKAKQQELAKRYGQNVPLDPRQDAEYMNALSRALRGLEQQYDGVIAEVRSRVREAAGMEEAGQE